jgi:hypothetical protein
LTSSRNASTYEEKNLDEALMLASKSYTDEFEANSRLSKFGVTRGDLRTVVKVAVDAARAATIDHPRTAGGSLSHIEGTAALRRLFRAKQWLPYRADNVEGVRDPESGAIIIFQNALGACSTIGPQPKNGKGPASEDLVTQAQGTLFTDEEIVSLEPSDVASLNKSVWYLCVTIVDEIVRAELSLPYAIEGGRFRGCVERIFIFGVDEWDDTDIIVEDPSTNYDYDVLIERKQ